MFCEHDANEQLASGAKMKEKVYYLLVKDWELALVDCPVERETKAMYFLKPGRKQSLVTGETVYGFPTQLRKSDPNVFLGFDAAAAAVTAILKERIAYKEKEIVKLQGFLARLLVMMEDEEDPTVNHQDEPVT